MDTKPLWTSAGVVMPVVIAIIIWAVSVERRITALSGQVTALQADVKRLGP